MGGGWSPAGAGAGCVRQVGNGGAMIILLGFMIICLWSISSQFLENVPLFQTLFVKGGEYFGCVLMRPDEENNCISGHNWTPDTRSSVIILSAPTHWVHPRQAIFTSAQSEWKLTIVTNQMT